MFSFCRLRKNIQFFTNQCRYSLNSLTIANGGIYLSICNDCNNKYWINNNKQIVVFICPYGLTVITSIGVTLLNVIIKSITYVRTLEVPVATWLSICSPTLLEWLLKNTALIGGSMYTSDSNLRSIKCYWFTVTALYHPHISPFRIDISIY